MKKTDLYIFYNDEDVVTKLKEALNIIEGPIDDISSAGSYESSTSFEDQLKESDWDVVGNGRHTILYYLVDYEVDFDGDITFNRNIEHVHVIIRHNTKQEIVEKSQEDIKKALTVLNDTDII